MKNHSKKKLPLRAELIRMISIKEMSDAVGGLSNGTTCPNTAQRTCITDTCTPDTGIL